MILVLFTESFPYDVAAEQTFLGEEIEHLATSFDNVVLVPGTCKGNRLPVPKDIVVNESYATLLRNASKSTLAFRVLFSRLVYQDLLARPLLLLHPAAMVRLVKFVGGALLTQRWVNNWLERTKIDSDQSVFYTYWFNQATMGIGLAKQRYPQIRVVSRVHGYDLYEERYAFPYLPCRRAALAVLDGLFPDSDAGTFYLADRYPDFASLYKTARLGVVDPGFVTIPSQDDVFRIASCSMISPVKRVDLLLQGIICAARMRPDQRFEWHHFGNGLAREVLQGKADNTFPSNAKAYLPGYSTKDNLLHFYKQNPIDVFLNVSKFEGTPVSIMEAISCGIPVIATAVGGNIEIVSEENGLLLNPNPTPEGIAESLLEMLDHPKLAAQKRNGSRRIWKALYNAEDNFQAFADHLKSIRLSGSIYR